MFHKTGRDAREGRRGGKVSRPVSAVHFDRAGKLASYAADAASINKPVAKGTQPDLAAKPATAYRRPSPEKLPSCDYAKAEAELRKESGIQRDHPSLGQQKSDTTLVSTSTASLVPPDPPQPTKEQQFNALIAAVNPSANRRTKCGSAPAAVDSFAAPTSVTAEQDQQKGEQEDEERNKRHQEVVDLLSGKKKLSAKFSRRYKIGDLIGDGAFGFVLTATRLSDGVEVAVKFVIKDRITQNAWINTGTFQQIPFEIHLLSQLQHPNIIRYIEHIDEGDYVLLISELHGTQWETSNPALDPINNPGLKVQRPGQMVPLVEQKSQGLECSPLFRLTPEQEKSIRRRTSCDLFECIDAHVRLSEAQCKKIFAQIAMGVHYLHSKGIVHRDLKDENIVIDANYWVKIVDFGSASYIPRHPGEWFKKFNGTAHFASPEVAAGQPYRGPEAEVWSLGVLLFTIIFGENPFQDREEIMKGVFKYPFGIESSCANLIERMLTYDEGRRATMEEVINHPWISSEVTKLRHCHSPTRQLARRKSNAAVPTSGLKISRKVPPHGVPPPGARERLTVAGA